MRKTPASASATSEVDEDVCGRLKRLSSTAEGPLRRTPSSHPALALLSVVLACQQPQGDTGVFTTVSPSTSAPDMTTSGEGTGSTSTTSSGSSSSGSISTTGEVSTSAASATGDSTTLVLDVGSTKDVDDPKPPGCQGKIDFLFVISRDGAMEWFQDKLVAAFPGFISTIQAKFADFDFHIMVIDGDAHWGHTPCNQDCTPEGCPWIPDYPCDLLGLVTACDKTMGAGTVFPAGGSASNKPCSIAGGRRYVTPEQPNLSETFACIAKLGVSGYGLLGEAFTAAMQPAINAPGGCNAGFLRDDALLMVTFIGGSDYNSKGDPSSWAAAALAAKNDDPNSLVFLEILTPSCPPQDRVCEMVKMFPYFHVADIYADDYSAAFDQATDLVEVACADFIPG